MAHDQCTLGVAHPPLESPPQVINMVLGASIIFWGWLAGVGVANWAMRPPLLVALIEYSVVEVPGAALKAKASKTVLATALAFLAYLWRELLLLLDPLPSYLSCVSC